MLINASTPSSPRESIRFSDIFEVQRLIAPRGPQDLPADQAVQVDVNGNWRQRSERRA